MDITQQNAAEAAPAKNVSTHFMVPPAMAKKLQLLAQLTRIQQSVYVREALRDGLARYDVAEVEMTRAEPTKGHLVSVVPRVPKDGLKQLKDLAERSRIRESEWWRLFLGNLLEKYSAKLERALEAA